MAGKYQVALSYASEQREYVERVATALEAAGVEVFYDRSETADMWGKDLAVHFDEVFRKGTDFVVFFVSKEYAAKTWTRKEFQSALARAIEVRGEYLLPVRFDDSELPGLVPTIGFVRARDYLPEELADLIRQKLGMVPAADAPPVATVRLPRLPRTAPADFNPYGEAERILAALAPGLGERAEALRPSGLVPYTTNRDGRFKLRILKNGEVKFALEAWIGNGLGGDDTINFHHGGRDSITPGSMTAWGTVEWDPDRGQPSIRLSIFSLGGPDNRALLSLDELVEQWWNVLVEFLEATGR